MFESLDFYGLDIQAWEWLAFPFYMIVILLIARNIQRKRIEKNPLYKFYVWGLLAKILGGIIFVFVYLYVYPGGDTTAYFESCLSMYKLLLTSPYNWLVNEFGVNSMEHFQLFDWDTTGYPLAYMYFDPSTYMVIRLVNPLLLFSFGGYLITTILLDWLAYAGIWRLFLVFSEHYPSRKKLFALAILFLPSVIFWGSGILKDSITLSCSGWVTYCIHRIFILKKNRSRFVPVFFISLAIIMLVKPYIIIALLPGSFMWIYASRIAAIKNAAAKFLAVPVICALAIGGGSYVLSFAAQYMGKYSLNNIQNTLIRTQSDLKQSYYHGHKFDIGLSDNPTPSEIIGKFPQAFVAGLYRPFLWESGNVVMVIAGLENTLILYLTISSIFQSNLIDFLKKLIVEPLLFFSLSFSIFFAVFVGISTANFGALVRFKIAYIPFFLCALFILIKRKNEIVKKKYIT